MLRELAKPAEWNNNSPGRKSWAPLTTKDRALQGDRQSERLSNSEEGISAQIERQRKHQPLSNITLCSGQRARASSINRSINSGPYFA